VRLGADSIEFILFSRWVFYRLHLTNIYQVIVGLGGWHFLTATNFRNRFSSSGTLLILKKDGFLARKVLITPAHFAAFMDQLVRAGVAVLGQERVHR
jgi:NADH:ubiquinone oxidoreductase subunit H